MTTKPLCGLTIASVLAGAAFAGLQVTDSPLGSASGCALSLGTEPATSGGAGLLLVPAADRFAVGSAGLKPARPRIARITP
jgi:hypothetical protein